MLNKALRILDKLCEWLEASFLVVAVLAGVIILFLGSLLLLTTVVLGLSRLLGVV